MGRDELVRTSGDPRPTRPRTRGMGFRGRVVRDEHGLHRSRVLRRQDGQVTCRTVGRSELVVPERNRWLQCRVVRVGESMHNYRPRNYRQRNYGQRGVALGRLELDDPEHAEHPWGRRIRPLRRVMSVANEMHRRRYRFFEWHDFGREVLLISNRCRGEHTPRPGSQQRRAATSAMFTLDLILVRHETDSPSDGRLAPPAG